VSFYVRFPCNRGACSEYCTAIEVRVFARYPFLDGQVERTAAANATRCFHIGRSITIMSLLGLAIIGRRNEPLYLCDCVRVLREAKQQQPGRRTPPPPGRARSDDDTSSAGGGAGDASTTTTSDLEGAATNDEAGSSSAADNAQEDKAGITAQQQSKQNDPPVLHDDETTEEGNNDDDADPFGFKEARHNCDLGQSLSFEQSLHLHSALDYVEERIETSMAGLPVVTSGRTGHWLGLLACQNDDGDDAEGHHVVYGYITATNVKLLVMVCPPVPKESNVRLFLNGIHDTFITHSMNPFSSVKPGQRITSKRFDANIREAVRDYEDNRIQQQ
jgi:Sedlin, N-terminal conserved region